MDAVAAYALGRLREENVSPHFNLFYGAFCARANRYRFNLSDDFAEYRHERWFWRGHQKGIFQLRILNAEGEMEEIPEDVLRDFKEAAEEESAESGSDSGTEILGGSEDEEDSVEEQSLHSADSMSDVSFAESSGSDAETEESESAEEDGLGIYAEIPNYPVMLILQERNSGTMDSLFEEGGEVIPGSPEWEAQWTAWLFQVVSALSVAQAILGFTHNDLHTNNIVWSPTDAPYIYYSDRAGSVFRVPTFGKVFRIIDFGRAIFKINRQIFISDDFKPGNDADGQYCFAPLSQKIKREVRPNPSFDLCRLALSLIDGVFPQIPADKEGGSILSDEPGLVVREKISALYNLLWSWMIDDEGRNIFINSDGSERFPDFDLYKHIAAEIHHAIPAQQFHSPAFDVFQIKREEVPNGERIYSLFA